MEFGAGHQHCPVLCRVLSLPVVTLNCTQCQMSPRNVARKGLSTIFNFRNYDSFLNLLWIDVGHL